MANNYEARAKENINLKARVEGGKGREGIIKNNLGKNCKNP